MDPVSFLFSPVRMLHSLTLYPCTHVLRSNTMPPQGVLDKSAANLYVADGVRACVRVFVWLRLFSADVNIPWV